MAVTRPPGHLGLHHAALFVQDMAASRRFWVDLLGFTVEWEPDTDNLYLTSGSDNLAIHRAPAPTTGPQRLDHLGVICRSPEDVDAWHVWLQAQNVTIAAAPRRHRDGAYSLYCLDPDGVRVQIIHHPPIADRLAGVQA